jgi:superfamily II DNA or RNA helicase
MIKARGWQKRALDKFEEHRGLCFLLDATPGAGKTIFSALCFQMLAERNAADFALIVVPTTAIKGDRNAGFLGDWHKVGIELTTVLKDRQDCPSEFKGGVITYQQLPNLLSTLEVWVQNGVRIAGFFDEVHHLSEDNIWGSAAERLARCCVKILAMTGTPFRGDGRRISFVSYDDQGFAKSDTKYSYKQSVIEGVCRPVEFITDDGIAEFIMRDEEEKVRLSEAKTDDEVRGASNTIFRADSSWMKEFLERADESVDEYRNSDSDAGGLVVCRPGTDERDEKYLMQISKLMREVTGDDPEVIFHEDRDANAKIEKFRSSTRKWVFAVRKISEGVDIKRLRVLVMATRPTTQLLFRQLVGRVVRVQSTEKIEYATVYIPKFPQLQEWAAKITKEAKEGLHEREIKERELSDKERSESSFVALGSTHEDGGSISDYGDEFTAAEINTAERIKQGDPQLFDIPVTKIAYLHRKLGIAIDPVQTSNNPLQIEKKEIRQDINKVARRLAIRRNHEQPDFARVWTDIHKHTGARSIDDLMDNYSIDVMRQTLHLIQSWLGGKDAAA